MDHSLPSVPPPQPPISPVPPPSPPLPPAYMPPAAAHGSGILMRRGFARMLDGVFLLPVLIFANYRYLWPLLRDYLDEVTSTFGEPGVQTVEPPITVLTVFPLGYYLVVGVSLFLYQFLGYYLGGASLGKRMLSIIVVDSESKSIAGNLTAALKRAGVELLGLVPAFGQLFGIVGFILVLMKGNRSIYDRAASTKVVRHQK